ncbi:MAG TPA: sugar ABC transporter substrate-binding protein [Clostridiales bacterium]|jgi:ABC-type sugar transport system substrate-binding protein|uniref:sugar ABC transporter substrate-binding protein n=1 Tax=Clostridia TaxID=186801 RepID=UPI00074080F1|nr:substrate-binding domain-containing protein [Clostridium sp. C105KSO13]CUX30146.1 ABC transporter periplasmic-binding protein YphF precursor [Clostridium sp. C105KSO13]HCS72975.1 sugar ABC transporter substrate-binding protein [Clostridiales bacterium]
MKRKVVSGLLSAVMVISMLAGCGKSDDTDVSSAQAKDNKSSGDKLEIGSVIMNTSGEWFAEVIQGMEGAAKKLDVSLSIVSSDNEVSKESDNVSTFVAEQVDALCISPLSTDASAAAIESAKEAGIPVINWNTTVDTDTDGFVGVSNNKLGGMTGEYVAEYVKENFPEGCKMALLTNSSYEVGVERCKGFEDAVKGVKGLEIVASQDAESQEEGLDITEQILTANPDIDLIWAWNQTSLLGCVAALQNAGNKDIVVMGTDMSVELAKDMLGDDVKLQAITTQMPYDIGYTAVENAVKAAKGEDIEKETLVPLKTYAKDQTDELETYIEEHKGLAEE